MWFSFKVFYIKVERWRVDRIIYKSYRKLFWHLKGNSLISVFMYSSHVGALSFEIFVELTVSIRSFLLLKSLVTSCYPRVRNPLRLTLPSINSEAPFLHLDWFFFLEETTNVPIQNAIHYVKVGKTTPNKPSRN